MQDRKEHAETEVKRLQAELLAKERGDEQHVTRKPNFPPMSVPRPFSPREWCAHACADRQELLARIEALRQEKHELAEQMRDLQSRSGTSKTEFDKCVSRALESSSMAV